MCPCHGKRVVFGDQGGVASSKVRAVQGSPAVLFDALFTFKLARSRQTQGGGRINRGERDVLFAPGPGPGPAPVLSGSRLYTTEFDFVCL